MAKMKLLPSLFSSVYSRVKLFVFAMNSRRRYSIFVSFIYGLEEKNSKSEVVFAVCRLPLTSCLTSLLSSARTVAETNYGISQDFPREIVEIRKGFSQSDERSKEGGARHKTGLR